MVKKTIVVKGVDNTVYSDFRAETVRDNRNMGETVTEAMKLWLEKKAKNKP